MCICIGVGVGVNGDLADPKTVLCSFFKAGNCEKGSKCKFSHDMNVQRKVEKKNLYSDERDDKAGGAQDSLIRTTLIVSQIQWRIGMRRNCEKLFFPKPATRRPPQMYCSLLFLLGSSSSRLRLCANFSSKLWKPANMAGFGNVQTVRIYLSYMLGTVELSTIPGESCQYRHALPPGFVLRSQKKAMDEAAKANVITLEEFLETEVCANCPYSSTLSNTHL